MLATAICGLALFGVTALMRWLRVDRRSYDPLIPLGFFLSYWLTYNRLPSFPPVGAVNKVFYIAAVGFVLGLVAGWIGSRTLGLLLLAGVALLLGGPVVVLTIGEAVWPDNATGAFWSAGLHALFYLYTGYGLLRYMFADNWVTRDELYATGA